MVIVVTMAIMLPVDFLIFDPSQAAYYANIRAVVICYMVFHFTAFIWLTKTNSTNQTLSFFLLLVPYLLINGAFLAFLLGSMPSDRAEIAISTQLVIIVCHFTLYKMNWEHLSFTAFNFVLLTILIFLTNDNQAHLTDFMVAHGTCFITALFLRRRFVKELNTRFENMKSFVPVSVARKMTITNMDITSDAAFKPKMRFTVCLIADWRSTI